VQAAWRGRLHLYGQIVKRLDEVISMLGIGCYPGMMGLGMIPDYTYGFGGISPFMGYGGMANGILGASMGGMYGGMMGAGLGFGLGGLMGSAFGPAGWGLGSMLGAVGGGLAGSWLGSGMGYGLGLCSPWGMSPWMMY
jgi:hypothetical protein